MSASLFIKDNMQKLEIYFTPQEYLSRNSDWEHIAVVVDILRATSTVCAALDSGVKAVIPVATLEEAKRKKAEGFIVVAERNTKKPDFADTGNDPLVLKSNQFAGKEIVMSTTNGTKAIEAAKKEKTVEILAGSFLNLTALSRYLLTTGDNVIILCSGWKGVYNLEDSFFAGALAERLLAGGKFTPANDAVLSSEILWKEGKNNILEFVSRASAYARLINNGYGESMEYIFTPDSTAVIPFLEGNKLIRKQWK